jgi:pSer/pThr/pTyr-binding forkhead associated (FHA) protein
LVFVEPATCLIGRSRDCTICLPQELGHLDVSGHHCVLEIVPPALRVRDLGSLNGTHVNGKKIGQRVTSRVNRDMDASHPPPVALLDGDEIRLGEHTVFRVGVYTAEGEKKASKRLGAQAANGVLRRRSICEPNRAYL